MMPVMHNLIGKTIKRILMHDDGEDLIAFDTNDGVLAYQTWGDCCSETWFADITGVEALIGGTVQSVEDVHLDEILDGRTRQEHDAFYGVKITTDKGYADIVYRNSSNGYYGGLIEEYRGSFVESKGMYEIVADWSAPSAS